MLQYIFFFLQINLTPPQINPPKEDPFKQEAPWQKSKKGIPPNKGGKCWGWVNFLQKMSKTSMNIRPKYDDFAKALGIWSAKTWSMSTYTNLHVVRSAGGKLFVFFFGTWNCDATLLSGPISKKSPRTLADLKV